MGRVWLLLLSAILWRHLGEFFAPPGVIVAAWPAWGVNGWVHKAVWVWLAQGRAGRPGEATSGEGVPAQVHFRSLCVA